MWRLSTFGWLLSLLLSHDYDVKMSSLEEIAEKALKQYRNFELEFRMLLVSG